MSDATPPDNHGHKSVTLLAIGLLIFTLFQFSMVFSDRLDLIRVKVELDKAIANADARLAEGAKMLDKLNDVAIATQKLANAGNSNAREIVNRLAKANITINTEGKKSVPEKAAPEKAPEAPVPPQPAAEEKPAAVPEKPAAATPPAEAPAKP